MTTSKKINKDQQKQLKISDIRISDKEYRTIMFIIFKQIKEKLKNMSRNKGF